MALGRAKILSLLPSVCFMCVGHRPEMSTRVFLSFRCCLSRCSEPDVNRELLLLDVLHPPLFSSGPFRCCPEFSLQTLVACEMNNTLYPFIFSFEFGMFARLDGIVAKNERRKTTTATTKSLFYRQNELKN